ncbi:hypothetical protein FN846DRAFT_276216 [Sphaerosporella brunnea]|uniref:Uncharacterized protein n=1 Tax=Sphaerosporella brunnea TaxID=1250544 RepID=A0A5J5EMG5_9PEZI|nr:hypothetical protein FN846DRAFT_276216 [Sphaerosporella brunnea]
MAEKRHSSHPSLSRTTCNLLLLFVSKPGRVQPQQQGLSGLDCRRSWCMGFAPLVGRKRNGAVTRGLRLSRHPVGQPWEGGREGGRAEFAASRERRYSSFRRNCAETVLAGCDNFVGSGPDVVVKESNQWSRSRVRAGRVVRIRGLGRGRCFAAGNSDLLGESYCRRRGGEESSHRQPFSLLYQVTGKGVVGGGVRK